MSDDTIIHPPIAYLTGEYPKVSHTFIQREIAAMRALGQDVHTFTVRRAPAKDVVGAAQDAEQASTMAILEEAKNPLRLLAAHFRILRRTPRLWFGAAKLAWKTRQAGLRATLYQAIYFVEAGVLADTLHARGIVHLHNHFANSSCTVAMLAAHMADIPYSFTLHGPAIFFEPMFWRIDEKIARSKFVSCISYFCRSQAMFFSDNSHWEKLQIVHCGVETENYSRPADRDYGGHVIFVGRLDAVKGVPLLLEAFAAVAEKYPDARLSVVGDGPHRAKLEAQAQATGLSDRIAFLGYRDQTEVAALLKDADILMLPSFAEGVPVVLMEAMASQLPVIASQVAGVSELVEDGVSGYVTPAGDIATIISRLDTLLSDPKLCAEMGKAGRKQVEVSFTQSTEAAKLLKHIRS